MKSHARVLIAGCGYVGCAAAKLLCGQGHHVFGARRDTTQLPAGIDPVAMDLLTTDFAELPEDLDAIVWALSPTRGEEGYRSAYVDAPMRLLQHLQERGDAIERAVLVASTSVWHRDDGGDVDERTATSPIDYRGESVLAGERAFHESPFSSVSLRLGGIYGPGRTSMLERIASGQVAPPDRAVHGNRIWRDDAASAITHVLAIDDPAPVYAVVDDDPADLRQVYAWIAEQLGVALPAATASFRGRGGNKRIKNHLLRQSGWRPSMPDFRSGYARLLSER